MQALDLHNDQWGGRDRCTDGPPCDVGNACAGGQGDPVVTASDGQIPRVRILVVDDSNISRAAVSTALSGIPDAEIREATDGQQALNAVEAGGITLVVCDINVPDDPDLQGSYWGVVFIEDSPEERIENETSSDAGTVVGILTAFRYAVQIYATIENSAVRDATFTSIDFQAVDEGFEVIAVLENKGNIFLRPEVRLELRDAYGNSVFEQEHVRQTILPESSREYVFQLTNLPVEPGPYLVMVVADYGVPTLIAAQGRVIIESSKADQAEE